MQEVPTRPANQPPGGPYETATVVWLVSYADDDDREMTAEQIMLALRAGELDMDVIVWRDGMVEWQPISATPELKAELERLATGPRGDRKRTVMGGFQAGQVGPALGAGERRGPPLPSGAPPPAAAVRSTLLGTGAQLGVFGMSGAVPMARGLSPAVPSPQVADLDVPSSSLDSDILESVRPSVELDAVLPVIPKQVASVGLTNLLRQRPGAEPESWDQEPTVSLTHDSIVSLPSDALESVVAFLPGMEGAVGARSRGIFEIDSLPPKAAAQAPVIANAPVRPRISERASESIFDQPSHVAGAPQIQVVAAPVFASASAVGQPSMPGPPRPPGRAASVLPSTSEVNVDLLQDQPPARRGSLGKGLLLLLLVGGLGIGMFYMGRQTAVVPSGAAAGSTATTGAAAAGAGLANPAAQDNAELNAAAQARSSASAEASTAAGAAAAGSDDKAAAAADDNSSASRAVGSPRVRAPRASSPVGSPEPTPKTEPKAPAPTEPKESASSDAPFDTAAASAALTAAAGSASSCRQAGDPSGVAAVTVTFANSGRATNANISGPPFAGTVTGGCIASKMRQARVPAFAGDRITVRKQVVIQ